MLTQERLKELLHYEPETGALTWIVSRGRVRAGYVAGRTSSNTYQQVCIEGKRYLSHRLAFLYMTGMIPTEVDHKNGDPSDNRWANLRGTTRSGNSRNRRRSKNNTSGVKGVSLVKSTGRWGVTLYINGKNRNLGTYDDIELAEFIAQEAREKYHGEFANHG